MSGRQKGRKKVSGTTPRPSSKGKGLKSPEPLNEQGIDAPKVSAKRRSVRHLSETFTPSLLEAARNLAEKAKAKAIFLYVHAVTDPKTLRPLAKGAEVILVAKTAEGFRTASTWGKRVIRVPSVQLNRVDQIKLVVLLALSERIVSSGDLIVCLSGGAQRTHVDTLALVEVGQEFVLAVGDLLRSRKAIDPKVFSATLNLAVELAHEGREGKPLGAIFVLGDHDQVLHNSRQMIMNPFRGHPGATRSILDPNLRETIKEFASLDGAFVVRGDGVVLSAGRHLNAVYGGDSLPQGLGARHAAAAAITGASKALAVTISESTGMVTIYRDGQTVASLEKSYEESTPVQTS